MAQHITFQEAIQQQFANQELQPQWIELKMCNIKNTHSIKLCIRNYVGKSYHARVMYLGFLQVILLFFKLFLDTYIHAYCKNINKICNFS